MVYFIIFVSSVCLTPEVWLRGLTMPSSSGMTIYRNRLGQFRTLNIRLESFWSHCLVVSAQFLGHSGPSWVSTAPSSGHLDPLSIPLSFFRESKAVLTSTIIFFFLRYFFLTFTFQTSSMTLTLHVRWTTLLVASLYFLVLMISVCNTLHSEFVLFQGSLHI